MDSIKEKFEQPSNKKILQQIVVSAAAGLCTGFLFFKVGKLLAVALGGGLLLLQVADHFGYVNINFGKIDRKIYRTSKDIEKKVRGRSEAMYSEFKDFAEDNKFTVAGFAGGFLLSALF